MTKKDMVLTSCIVEILTSDRSGQVCVLLAPKMYSDGYLLSQVYDNYVEIFYIRQNTIILHNIIRRLLLYIL